MRYTNPRAQSLGHSFLNSCSEIIGQHKDEFRNFFRMSWYLNARKVRISLRWVTSSGRRQVHNSRIDARPAVLPILLTQPLTLTLTFGGQNKQKVMLYNFSCKHSKHTGLKVSYKKADITKNNNKTSGNTVNEYAYDPCTSKNQGVRSGDLKARVEINGRTRPISLPSSLTQSVTIVRQITTWIS